VRNADRRANAIDRFLDAALEVLVEGGYAQFRVGEVAQRSGLSQGSLFRYFPTKDDLVRAALERSLSLHRNRLAEAFADVDPHTITRRQLMERLWSVLSHRELAWTYELYAATAYDQPLRSKLEPILVTNANEVDQLARLLVSGTGLIAESDIIDSTNMIIWGMQGLRLNDMARGETGREARFMDFFDSIASRLYDNADART
jgi:AcrR family transcriptional regulator